MITTQEADWKYMSKLKPALLERLCNRILDKIQAESLREKRSTRAHEQYLKVYKLVRDQDKLVADCFNDWRRSNLFEKIAFLYRYKLMTPEELQGLSEETRELLRSVVRM